MSQTDFAVLFPKWMDLFIKTLVHPQRGIYLTVRPTLEFLKIVRPRAQTLSYNISDWVDKGLLKSQPHLNISVEHRPDEKWTAARLRIDNELQVRLRKCWAKTWQRRRGDEVESMPKDTRGGPLFRLKTWGPGEEIWMHMCPAKVDVDKHVEHRDGRETEQPC